MQAAALLPSWRQQFVSFTCGLLITAAGLIFGLNHQSVGRMDYLGYFALDFLSYVFLGFCFFNAINLNISSLRIRMLKEYRGQSQLPLSDSLLMARYNVREMLDVRLKRLEAGRQIHRSGERFYSRHGIAVWIGHLFAGLRQILGTGLAGQK